MADVKVSKESSSGQEQRGGAVGRRGEAFPSLFSMSPREFFSYSPFQLMRRFSEDLDRAFSGHGWGEGYWAPAIEVREQGNNLLVHADLPGINKEDIKVEVTGEGLTISGERKHERKEEREGYYHSERSYGRFFRRVPLPEAAQTDQIRASFHNGVLEITVPVPQAEKKRREIQVESGGGQTRAAG